MKISTERRENSIVALDIELSEEQVEKGLNRAAKRLAEKHTIPGFRKGKAPRFIIENYFGRETLLDEATDDLINRSFRAALEQAGIEPVGQAQIESMSAETGFRFVVAVPVAPTVTVPDYRAFRLPFVVPPIGDEQVAHAMAERRERHVVLQELDEPRPVQQGDQLRVQIVTLIDGEPTDDIPEGEEPPENTLVVEPDRLVQGLYDGVLGMQVDEHKSIETVIEDDHPNEEMRGKTATFEVKVLGIQSRLLPDWDELPMLEEFEGTLDELRADTRNTLEERAKSQAERDLVTEFIARLVAETEYDIPEVLIRNNAEELLEAQGQQFAQYGITLDQMLQFRGQTREEAVGEMFEAAENDLKERLAMIEVVQAEQLKLSPEEVQEEAAMIMAGYDESTRQIIAQQMQEQFVNNVANAVLDRKLRERLLAIAAGEAPEPGADAGTVDAGDAGTADAGDAGTADAGDALVSDAPTASEDPATDSKDTSA